MNWYGQWLHPREGNSVVAPCDIHLLRRHLTVYGYCIDIVKRLISMWSFSPGSSGQVGFETNTLCCLITCCLLSIYGIGWGGKGGLQGGTSNKNAAWRLSFYKISFVSDTFLLEKSFRSQEIVVQLQVELKSHCQVRSVCFLITCNDVLEFLLSSMTCSWNIISMVKYLKFLHCSSTSWESLKTNRLKW